MDTNYVYTGESNYISSVNSTNTPLGINGIFTGEWEETTNYSEIIVSVFASVPSVTDGLKIQWSADGATVHQEDVFTISSSSGKCFTFQAVNKYMRIYYQNDGVAQTSFNIQTALKTHASKGSSHRLKDNLQQEDDAIVTKSQIVGFSTAGGGTLVNVKANPSGSLQIGGDVGIVDSTDTQIDPATEESSGLISQKVPDVTGAEVLNYFTFATEGGDFVTSVSTSNGQNVTCLVIDPTTDDKRSIVTQTVPIKANAHISAIEASMNQRPRHQFATMEMSTDDVVPVYTQYSISTLQQATTTLTLTMASSVLDEWTIGDWINIWGCADNRINYPNFVIATISADGLVVTGTVSDEATIPSLSVGPYSTAGMKAQKRRQLLGQDGYGMRFSGTSATAAAYLTKFGSNITKVTGTLVGTQTVTCASTAPTFTSGATGQVDIRTTSKFFSRCDADGVGFFDKAIDSNAIATQRTYFSGVKPGWQKTLYAKYNAISPKSMTRPIAKIVSAVKTGTTTATITTDIPHGLSTTNYVTIKGIRDQTNFANLTTPTVVASTPTSTTFTIVIGTAVTATSYGGSVILAQGGVDQPGIIGQTIQSITSNATTGFVTLVGSASWSGLNVGEYIYIHGVRNSTNGADIGYNGAWEVVTLSTTTLIVKAIYNYAGVRVSPTFTTLGTTNCGGAVILMTTLRSHDNIMSEYAPRMTQIEGQGTNDISKALPVYSVGGTQAVSGTVTANEGTALTASNSTVTTTASTNATSVKTTAGHIYSIIVSNPTATACYLKLYNKASAPTVGTDTPTSIIPIPANSFAAYELGRIGDRYTTGIALAVTGAIGATDTTNSVAGVYIKTNYI